KSKLFWRSHLDSVFRLQSDSVQRWLDDLRHMTEVECMCVLQAKPLDVVALSLYDSGGAWPARSNLQTLLRRALVVSTELSRMFSRVEKGRWQRTHSTSIRANCHLRSLLQHYTAGRSVPQELLQVLRILLPLLLLLNLLLLPLLLLLLLKQHLHKTQLSPMKSTTPLYFDLLVLFVYLFVCLFQEGAVVALFKLCRQDQFKELYAPALRTIASICCVEEGVLQLDKVDGLLCLADLLTDDHAPEAVKAESAAVVAQLTSPHHSSTAHLLSFIESMNDIVTALISLCSSASCGEVFLLAAAALANITFLDSLACEILLQSNAVQILVQASRDRTRVDTPYSKDQVVTILANLSVLEQCSQEVLQEQGVERLLSFLGERPSSSSPSEGAACERVQQKAAVTLARLSRDHDFAQNAIKLNAVPRLIELCRSPTERNNSDSVLVACLAALRRLAAVSPESLELSDHQQLIAPRLVDSFLLCSNMEESFV
uniref:Uncharacterized protein n=1 Tax=Periophthalmus magnuspinnatus TaxID=409849 RepID=A0A3B4A626_9GOBI